MQKITTIAALCLALLPAIATPAAAQNREHLQLAAELRMLQEQNQQLSLAITQLADALKAVNARLDTSEEFQRRRFADQEVLVKNLGSDLGTIRERTQDTDTRLRTLKDEIDALRQTFLSLPALIAQSQGSVAPIDPNNPTPLAPAPDGPSPVGPPSPSPNLPLPSTFPTAERADDAQFFIGESLGNMNRLPEAIDAYNLVIQKYPTGDQVDMAYYRRGFVESQMGRADAARATWEEVVKRFPDSQGAQLARQRLAGLKTTPAAPAK